MTIIGICAASWGLVMALSPVLQIIRMLQVGSSRDVSVGYFLLLIPGFLLWVIYGLVKSDAFVALPNALAALIGFVVVAVALRLRRSENLRASAGDD